MDHHCRWVANCVGQRNMKYFLNFVTYMALYCLHTVVIISLDGIKCILSSHPERQCHVNNFFLVNTIMIVVTGALATFICLFCVCQLLNQLRLIKRNRSFIDNLARRQETQQIEL